MASEAQMIGYGLLKTGTLVSFRIVDEITGCQYGSGAGEEGAALEATDRPVEGCANKRPPRTLQPTSP
jgi:hypothetical protein